MPKTVLIIDAEEPFAKSVAGALKALGVKTARTANPQAALNLARREPPAAILLCAELPKRSGYYVCATIKRDPALSTVPVVITSADASEETFAEHAKLEEAADGYVLKPAETTTVIDALRPFLGTLRDRKADATASESSEPARRAGPPPPPPPDAEDIEAQAASQDLTPPPVPDSGEHEAEAVSDTPHAAEAAEGLSVAEVPENEAVVPPPPSTNEMDAAYQAQDATVEPQVTSAQPLEQTLEPNMDPAQALDSLFDANGSSPAAPVPSEVMESDETVADTGLGTAPIPALASDISSSLPEAPLPAVQGELQSQIEALKAKLHEERTERVIAEQQRDLAVAGEKALRAQSHLSMRPSIRPPGSHITPNHVAELRKERNEKHREIVALTETLTGKERAIADLNERETTLSAQLADVERTRDEYAQKVLTLEGELHAAEMKLEEYQRGNESKMARLRQKNADLDVALIDAQRRIEYLSAQLGLRMNELKSLQRDSAARTKENAWLVEQLEARTQDISALNARADGLEIQSVKAHEVQTALKNDLEATRQDLYDRERTIANLEQKALDEASEAKNAATQAADLTERVRVLEEDNGRLSIDLAAAVAELDKAREQREQRDSTVEALHASLATLEGDVMDYKMRAKSLEADVRAAQAQRDSAQRALEEQGAMIRNPESKASLQALEEAEGQVKH